MTLSRLLRSGLSAGLLLTACAPVLRAEPAALQAESVRERLKHLSLRDAQDLALRQNWDLLAAAAGVDAASARLIVAREFPNPTLGFGTSKINVGGGNGNSTVEGNGLWERSYDTVIAVNQLFEIGGKRKNRRLSAQAGLEAAKAQLLDAKRVLDLGVARSYITSVLADENAAVLRSSAASLRQEATLAETRLKAGEISAADKTRIDITASRFELDAKAAEAAAAQARVTLQILLGMPPPQQECELADPLETLAAAGPSPDQGSTSASRPDILAAEAAFRQADAEVRLQKANRVPDPTVVAQYEHEPPDSINSIGFGLSFPLPLWHRNKGGVLTAEAAREQARLALEKTKAQAAGEIATATVAYDEANRRWDRYRGEIRPKSAEVRSSLAFAYHRGSASLLDMLLAERNDNEVRLAAMQAAADTALARANLLAARGGVPTNKRSL